MPFLHTADGLKNGTGIYAVMFGVSMYYLVRPSTRKYDIGSRRSLNKAIISGGLLLFLTITVVSLDSLRLTHPVIFISQQWALIVFETFQAFVGHAGIPLGPLLYIVDLSKPSEIAHMIFYLIELTISDFILVCDIVAIISFS